MDENALIEKLLQMRKNVTNLLPVATPAELEQAEKILRVPIPHLLRRLYLEIANGGFGYTYGVLGIGNGYTDNDTKKCAEMLYQDFRLPVQGRHFWPEFYLPFCYRGCSLYSVLDCRKEDPEVLSIDLGLTDFQNITTGSFTLESPSLLKWMEGWIASLGKRQ